MANPAEFKDNTESVMGMAKVIEASPRRSDVAHALGRKRRHLIKDLPGGKWNLSLGREDERAVHAISDLYSKQRELLVERKRERDGRSPQKVRVRTKDGRIVRVREENASRLNRIAGVVPVPSYGGQSVVEGPDGMLWFQIAGYWAPTGRCKPGFGVSWIDRPEAEGPQRDPEGNLWDRDEAGEYRIILTAEEVGHGDAVDE